MVYAVYVKRDLGLGETDVGDGVGQGIGRIIGRDVPDDAPWNGIDGAQDTTDATSHLGDSLSK
ncbi:hypothetical protein CU097_004515 [Rhizopus azygosporus]|uniref:Uncharacterized protein n=1 Tax=Rhizopus azygosporus TaxID=86630 RepID=A0A367J843_RHIAZ|nr:hypothetical protein CU097_004515 [Rhizopus azygosporus]